MNFKEDKWKYIFKMFLITIGIISVIVDGLFLKKNSLGLLGFVLVFLGYFE